MSVITLVGSRVLGAAGKPVTFYDVGGILDIRIDPGTSLVAYLANGTFNPISMAGGSLEIHNINHLPQCLAGNVVVYGDLGAGYSGMLVDWQSSGTLTINGALQASGIAINQTKGTCTITGQVSGSGQFSHLVTVGSAGQTPTLTVLGGIQSSSASGSYTALQCLDACSITADISCTASSGITNVVGIATANAVVITGNITHQNGKTAVSTSVSSANVTVKGNVTSTPSGTTASKAFGGSGYRTLVVTGNVSANRIVDCSGTVSLVAIGGTITATTVLVSQTVLVTDAAKTIIGALGNTSGVWLHLGVAASPPSGAGVHLTLPARSDFRSTVALVNTAMPGTCAVPTAQQTQRGVAVGTTTGTLGVSTFGLQPGDLRRGVTVDDVSGQLDAGPLRLTS